MSALQVDLTTYESTRWDRASGQMTFPDGTVICHHARQISTHRLTRPGWRFIKRAGRWARRRRTAPLLLVTTRCPDCPAVQVDAFDPGVSGYLVRLAPHVTMKETAA